MKGVRTHGKWSTYNTCRCRCPECVAVGREHRREQQRRARARRRAADLNALEQCMFCREWFANVHGLHNHESLRHGNSVTPPREHEESAPKDAPSNLTALTPINDPGGTWSI